MEKASLTTRSTVVPIVMLAVGLALPSILEAQSGRSANERVLVLPPLPMDGTDTSYAITFASELRNRMAAKYRFRLSVIPSETICEALQASGFDCDGILDPQNADPLARFLQASGYIVGWVDHGRDSTRVSVRLVDRARSGLSGWNTFSAPAARSVQDIARDVSDGLDDQVKAAEQARECDSRRERSDFGGARDRAQRAFGFSPNHPSAAMCVALIFEVQQQPEDSLIFVLEKAVRGDSLNARAWEMLGRRYLANHDTVKAINAFESQLRADPNNLTLRHGVAVARMQQGDFEAAVEILQYALDRNPLDLPTLQFKARACVDGEIWPCALDALAAQYEVDSALIGNGEFYGKIFGAAQSIPDTAAMLQWSEEAVSQIPTSVALWRARAAALKDAGERDRALEAYDRIIALDTTQLSSALAAVQLLLDSTLVIDSTVPLDTMRLARADSLLQLVLRGRQDTTTVMNVALSYFGPGARMVQHKIHYPLAARFLEQAVAHDLLNGRLSTQANFFLGLAYFFQVPDLDTEVRESKSCEMVDVEMNLITRGIAAMTTGASISQQTATTILQYLRQYDEAVKTYKPVFECP